jgi:hypothetical protein
MGAFYLKEEHKPRLFENRVLRRILGSKWVEVTGGRRKLHNGEHNNLHPSQNKSRRMKCVWYMQRA